MTQTTPYHLPEQNPPVARPCTFRGANFPDYPPCVEEPGGACFGGFPGAPAWFHTLAYMRS